MAKNDCLQAGKLSRIKIPWLDLYIVRGSEKRRVAAELAALKKSSSLRNKVTARLLHENIALKKRLARWEPYEIPAKPGKGK